MSESKYTCAVCDGFSLEDPKEIIKQHMDHLQSTDQEDQRLDILTCLFNSGYLQGFKAALMERVQSDVVTLRYMNGQK